MKTRLDLPLVLLAVSLFLAPLIGGQVSVDAAFGGGFLDVLVGGPEAPLLTHALLFVPIALALTILLRRQVVQVPNTTLTVTLFLFFGLVVASVTASAFRSTSLGTAAEWLAYALAFLTTVGAAGRSMGPRVLAGASFAGCVLMAMRGLLEYGSMKAVDPNWRIFAGWVNPNATAAMLLVGCFLGLGLLATSRDRLPSLIVGLGVVLNGFALALTQSKGAFLVAVLGGLAFVALVASIWRTGRQTGQAEGALAPRWVLIRTASIVVVVGLLAAVAAISPQATSGTGGGGPLTRIANASETQTQSSGFRTLLWKGALRMIKANPVGYGPGTYRFESGRSGLHTQTVYTHNAFLQLAVESSPLAPLLLLLAGALWTRLAFRGWRTLPNDRRYLQASVFCSVVAVAAHSVVDSDLYYFGIGLTFFTLLGLGLLLSADAVAPEFAPRSARSVGIAGGALAFLLLGYTGIAELWRAQARGQLAVRDAQGAAATLASLRSLAPQDGEAWYYTAQVAPTSSERLEALQRAAALAPTTRNLRALARLQSEAGQLPTAITTTRTALMRDPNNLPALTLLADLQRRSGDAVAANETLRRLVAVEQTPYFQVRSLPELVPTETYMARLTLAQTATGATKAALLQPAVDGLTQYLQRTVPMVKRMAAGTPPMDFGGETPERAREKLAVGERAARELAATYRALGDTGRAEAAEGAAGAFAAGFDK